MLLKLKKKAKGFTLIELMIVVVIIGILAALAIPNFLRYQAKSKQSEAKTNLGAIYVSQTAYYGEWDSYCNAIADLDWAPEGTTRYTYSTSGAATAFTAGAVGNIDNDATDDYWTIDNTKTLTNVVNDVTTD